MLILNQVVFLTYNIRRKKLKKTQLMVIILFGVILTMANPAMANFINFNKLKFNDGEKLILKILPQRTSSIDIYELKPDHSYKIQSIEISDKKIITFERIFTENDIYGRYTFIVFFYDEDGNEILEKEEDVDFVPKGGYNTNLSLYNIEYKEEWNGVEQIDFTIWTLTKEEYKLYSVRHASITSNLGSSLISSNIHSSNIPSPDEKLDEKKLTFHTLVIKLYKEEGDLCLLELGEFLFELDNGRTMILPVSVKIPILPVEEAIFQ